jgi:type VI secretion system secreted protein VgrG
LPTNQTQSGIKSRSSKTGTGENFNEIRFEDKKDSEEVYVHAEKDFNCVIENNETRQIGVVKKDKGDQTIEIQNNRTVTLNQGNDLLTIKTGNLDTNVDQGNDTITIKTGNYALKVNAGKATITAAQSIELTVGGSSIKMDPSSITIKSPTITIQANGTLEAESPMTTVKGTGVLTLSGALTKIN